MLITRTSGATVVLVMGSDLCYKYSRKRGSGMRKLAREFLMTTFAIMAVSWGTCLLCSFCGLYLAEAPLLYIPYLLGGLSPTIASYVVQKQNRSVRNLKEWLKSIFDFRQRIVFYLLLPVLAGLFFFCLCSISGYTSGAPLIAVIVMIPMMLLGGGLEETGWRGILQPELEITYGFTTATLLVALIWWLWHLPLFFINGVSQYGADFVAFGIHIAGLSFALSAIRKITNSTFLCVLFHCLINALHGVYIVAENRLGSAAAAMVLILSSYVLVWTNKKSRISE